MAIGKIRNRRCPYGHTKKAKNAAGKVYTYVPKYKDCCWDQDYWAGFTKIKMKKEIKRNDGLLLSEIEVINYRKGASV
jgi:hypothetical protein